MAFTINTLMAGDCNTASFISFISKLGIGNTYYSQGGIACALHPKDSSYLHMLDTLKALKEKEACMKLVAIGGGTGLSTLLRGLKEKVMWC